MEYFSINIFKKRSKQEFGLFLFLLGIFFLPSTMVIGIIFLFFASIIGSFLQKKSYLKDYWNYPFLIFGSLILSSSLIQNIFIDNKYIEIWNPHLSFIGLANWIPFIWIFWAVQPFLDSKVKRRSFALILIAGTFPVLITGLGQYFLNWTGPFKTLYGLIIWYQRPIEFPGGLSGLFNNQNYAASWLNFVWPFCLALFLEKGKTIFRKAVAYSFLFSTGFSAFLTFSRNAWIGLITSFPIVTGKKGFAFILPILTIFLLILFFIFSPFFNGELQNNLRNILPEKILLEFAEEGYKGLDTTRLNIFNSAIKVIKENPLFGSGAASFPEIFFLETNFWKGHSHNLLLELSISYGLPSSVLFFTTITNILFLSGKKIFIPKEVFNISLFDRAFWAALFSFLISQLADIQYFDGKISTIMWILVAGLKNIIQEKN